MDDLSKSDIILVGADQILTELFSKLQKLPDSLFKSSLITNLDNRIRERRNPAYDVMLWLFSNKIDPYSQKFYSAPSVDQIEKLVELFEFDEVEEEVTINSPKPAKSAKFMTAVDPDELNIKGTGSSIEYSIDRFIDHGELTGTMKQFIKILQCIRPTSTSSERTFSLAGHIISPRRTRLLVENASRYIILNRFFNMI